MATAMPIEARPPTIRAVIAVVWAASRAARFRSECSAAALAMAFFASRIGLKDGWPAMTRACSSVAGSLARLMMASPLLSRQAATALRICCTRVFCSGSCVVASKSSRPLPTAARVSA